MSALHKKLKEEIKEALRARDSVRLTTVRGLVSACTNELVAKKRKPDESLTDEEVLTVIKRAVKQRKDSIEQFRLGGREDLAEKEQAELLILEKYLPEQMSTEDIEKIVSAKIKELGVADKSGMGKLIGAVMKETKGQADGTDVKSAVEKLLN